jgi:hypothetical protein
VAEIRPLAQSGVLEVPGVQLEYELASTRQQTDLDADGVTPSYDTFHPLRVDNAGGN